MFKTIKGRMIYLQAIMIFITLGVLFIIFVSCAEEYYFSKKINIMKRSFKYLNTIELGKLDSGDKKIISFEEQKLKFIIVDESYRPIYVSGKGIGQNAKKDKERIQSKIENRIIKKLHLFDENNFVTKNGQTRIHGRGMVKQNGHTYYVYIYELKTGMKIHFSYYRIFFAFIIVFAAFISIIISSIISNKISKPIKQMEINTRMAVKNGYNISINEHQEFKELSGLAESINMMIAQIRNQIETLEQEIQRKNNVENMRQQFVNNVSHEMKTPLAIISTQVEMILLLDDEEKRKEYCNSIIEETENMSELINEMIVIYSIQSDQEALMVTNCDISDLVRTLCKGYFKLFRANHIILKEEYDLDTVAQVNEKFIKQAVSNYITNSIKHSKEDGEVIVRVLSRNESVRIEVENQGQPIDETYRDKIWDMFYSGDGNETLNGQKSSGLGLYLVKSIAELHDAKYGFDNIENGVIFYIDIPKVQN